MVIVKAQGNFALAMSVFPKGGNNMEVLSLKNPHGFYVQQITGERRLEMIDEQCYRIHGQRKHITMYREGPDVIMVPTYYNLYGHELPKDPYFWKNSKKRYHIPMMIPTVYIVDDNIDRLHHTRNLFRLPIGRIYGAQQRYYYKDFVDVSGETMRTALKMTNSIKTSEFECYIRSNAVSTTTMVVSIFTKKQLRVKLISSSDVCGLLESHIIEEVIHNGIQYFFGDEHKDLKKTSGILLFAWYAKCHDDFPSLSYDWVTSLHSVYGDGFGSRDWCSCYGLNTYQSKWSTARPHPTPFVSDDDIAEHQYFNGEMKVPLLQPIMERHISDLSDQVTMVSREMNIPLFELLGGLCTKTILTAGSGHTSAFSIFKLHKHCACGQV